MSDPSRWRTSSLRNSKSPSRCRISDALCEIVHGNSVRKLLSMCVRLRFACEPPDPEIRKSTRELFAVAPLRTVRQAGRAQPVYECILMRIGFCTARNATGDGRRGGRPRSLVNARHVKGQVHSLGGNYEYPLTDSAPRRQRQNVARLGNSRETTWPGAGTSTIELQLSAIRRPPSVFILRIQRVERERKSESACVCVCVQERGREIESLGSECILQLDRVRQSDARMGSLLRTYTKYDTERRE